MAAILKIVKRHISVKNSPILMKFGTLHQILSPITVTLPNIEIFEIQDGGGRHLENRFYSHSSSTIVRFQRNFVWESRTPWQQGLHDKIYKFLKSDFDEIPYTTANVEADYSHVTKNYNFWNSIWRLPTSWKSLFWPLLINRLSDFSEILYEKAERHADKGYGTIMQMCKIQDGGRRHFENR